MWTDRVQLLDDASVAGWLPPRVTGVWGTVSGVVPAGYAAYARVLHPVEGGDAASGTRWSEVAQVTGRRTHPLVQWHRLLGSDDPWNPESGLWPDGRPHQGSLATETLLALSRVLAEHTSTPERITFALWEGFGQLHVGARGVLMSRPPARTPSRLRRLGRRRPAPWAGEPVPPCLSEAEMTAPRLRLPGRDYLLFDGPLDAMDAFVHYDGESSGAAQSPNLFWPADHAWCVGTEIDLDSTLVAGDADLIAAVLACPDLEAWPVRPTDSLQHDTDTVNL